MMQSFPIRGALALGFAAAGLYGAPQAAMAASSFAYVSETGDVIGDGKRGSYTDANAQFQLRGTAYEATLDISTGDKVWTVRLAPPPGERLRPGRYYLAEHFRERTGRAAGAYVSTDRSYCTYAWSTVQIRQIAFDSNGAIKGLEAVVQQRCDHDVMPLLTVAMSHNVAPLSFKFKRTFSDPVRNVDLGYAGDTSLFALNGTDSLLSYEVDGRQNRWRLKLTPPTGKRLLKGTYALASVASANALGLDMYSRSGHHAFLCEGMSGTLQIKDVRYSSAGAATALWADFEYRCADGDAVRGVIRHKL
ncbi:hypothetical protein ABU614_20740 [Lysobacter firmicutimachus]|uniref:Secreted protein n=1 Tax=Lysobacter firmicutimachus TaxID=1792846 RepID=A0AAU8MNN9_9GAMM|nr:hypothetical protein [Lysobacter antibioticus]